jgi:hypothetical protein
MPRVLAGVSLLGAVLLAALAHGCGAKKQPPAPLAEAPPQPPSSPDRLDPNEAAEGLESAFDLKIPRGMRVSFRGPDEVDAVGQMPAERVANYVRRRVVVDGVELGAARTVFDRARVKGEPTGRRVRVEVIADDPETKLVVRDLSLPKADLSLSPEERWKQFGFDKDGKLADPSRMK